jgi:cellulose synthase/poly-beta-1,6-N-acetylglucosamine synthase-like glycosyltransferase
MAAANLASGKPLVSVIVPARNEEASLGACLESLVSQTGVEKEIIVVDDGSTDRTRQIAESYPGIRVIEPGPLPGGWIGKNNAVIAGAKVAHGEWLLFTDADTVHLPGSLAKSVAEAREKGVSLLSYSPKQQVHGFWEKAVMPVIFAELAATFRPSEVSNPKSPAAAANGQYILVKRSAYEAVGGHGAVATNLLEDVALARKVKYSGRKIFFRFGGDAVRTRMYRSFSQLCEGWTKNLALLFPSPLRLATLRLSEFALIATSAAATVFEVVRGQARLASLCGALCAMVFALFMVRIRKAHFSTGANTLAIFGLPLFVYLLWRSRLFHKRGKVQWKGRIYSGPQTDHVVTTASAVTPNKSLQKFAS